MLFNSYPFIFFFLPITLAVFFWIGGRGYHTGAAAWLAVASLFFYGWWNPLYVPLLLASVVFNFLAGRAIAGRPGHRTPLLVTAVLCNLALLGYFKYANFLLGGLNDSLQTGFNLAGIVLPLGVSFFTFTQIAFLADAHRGGAKEYSFVHYLLFVTYFPHLIAGPILHHKEMMPQFGQPDVYRLNHENLAVGLGIFAVGLFKKVVLADGVAPFASQSFDAAAYGVPLTLFEAWGGALAYTLQLYFDFSGYSDMAIGLSRLFGITLPVNFHSPYKAVNIAEFWRCWHMTLMRFLRDYLYVPLGGSHQGRARHYLNLMVTMLLSGLWHGAGWTFVIWGGLHGLFLIVNHAWRELRRRLGQDLDRTGWTGRVLARSLTFVAVVVAWVFFRADNLETALSVLRGMMGAHGVVLPDLWLQTRLSHMGWLVGWLANAGVVFGNAGTFKGLGEAGWIAGLLCIVWFMPNTQQIFHDYRPALNVPDAARGAATVLQWQPTWRWALICSVLLVVGIVKINRVSEFLYFQF